MTRTCILGLVLALAGCASSSGKSRRDASSSPPSGSDSTATSETVATVQQSVPVSEFEALLEDDEALQSAWEQAQDSGYTEWVGAGVIEDGDGVRLHYGAVSGEPGEALVLRHCSDSGCVHALQTLTDGGQDIEWRTSSGVIPVRTIQMPLWLRDYDESDPDSATLATIDTPQASDDSDNTEESARPETDSERGALSSGKADEASNNHSRQLRLLTTFNQYMTLQGSSFSTLISDMREGGFPNAEVTYAAASSQLDSAFRELGPSDALVVVSHGDQSASQGRVVGMTMNQHYWGSEHYSENRMLEQLASSETGGPGIIFLAGCKTAGMLSTLDNGSRAVFGFTGKITPGLAARAISAFFDRLSNGGTLGDARDAANAELSKAQESFTLESSTGSPLDRRLVDVGTTPDCADGMLGQWQGKLTVIEGSDNISEGMETNVGCGDFVLSTEENEFSGCSGCYFRLEFKNRVMVGCGTSSPATLSQLDDGSYISTDASLVGESALSVEVQGEDSAGSLFTRSGILSPCP